MAVRTVASRQIRSGEAELGRKKGRHLGKYLASKSNISYTGDGGISPKMAGAKSTMLSTNTSCSGDGASLLSFWPWRLLLSFGGC
jgi:hypothetical protein